MLDVALQQGGSQYRRLIAALERALGATILFGTDTQREKPAVMHEARIQLYARGADLVLAGCEPGGIAGLGIRKCNRSQIRKSL